MTSERKLFDELMDGVDSMQQQREGKVTLRSHEVEDLPPLEIDAELIRQTGEQGRARPNAQAAALILMARQFPDTLQKLSEFGHRAA